MNLGKISAINDCRVEIMLLILSQTRRKRSRKPLQSGPVATCGRVLKRATCALGPRLRLPIPNAYHNRKQQKAEDRPDKTGQQTNSEQQTNRQLTWVCYYEHRYFATELNPHCCVAIEPKRNRYSTARIVWLALFTTSSQES